MRRRTLTLWALALCASVGGAQESEIVLGREDGWSDLYSVDRVRLEPGRWGHLDVVLDDRLETISADLWVGFDVGKSFSGRYQILPAASGRGNIGETGAEFVRGGSSGSFGGDAGLALLPTTGALLAPGRISADFSLQFWMYPATLSDGEELLDWSGSVPPPVAGGAGFAQRLSATFIDRRVHWRFDGLFRGADAPLAGSSVELAGLTPLVPRRWRHHLLRFDSGYGTLEYLIDGEPQAITHITSTRQEGGSVFQPWVGSGRVGTLEVGSSFVGLLDDLQITTDLATPQLTRFANASGWAATRVYDLGHPETLLGQIQIDSDASASDAEIFYYYRLADRPFSPETHPGSPPLTPPALQFEPGVPLSPPATGRYLQLLFELLPSGDGATSPRLQQVLIRYLPVAAPPPPAALTATAGDGRVRLDWRGATHYDQGASDIGGYLVYFGTEPGRYLAVAGRLRSPLDIGQQTTATVTGLDNGQVYYFSVVAYDVYDPPRQSSFTQEVAARPAAIRRLP